MRNERRKGNMAGLAALCVFGVFAVCVLLVLHTGADAYRRLTERDQIAYSRRTAAQYITTRVRQADEAGQISLESWGGMDVLVLTEELDGVLFDTRVYCHDGILRELFSFAGEPFAPEDGEELLPLTQLELALEGQVLTAAVTNEDGTAQTLTLYLRGGEGVKP